MLRGAAAGTGFLSRLGEGAALRARPAADAGGRERMAVAVRKAEKELLPLEVRAAATRDAALPGAAQRGQQQRALVLSAQFSLRALQLSLSAALLLRLVLPEEVRRCDDAQEPALRER